jgi:NCS1 nucleoside transporter family
MSDIEFREGEYGEKLLAVEPGGVEAIPEADRHGKPWNLFAVWTSPNLEFATIYVGALGVFFGLSFTQAVLGAILGNALGALGSYFLTQDGPKYGVPQMVLSRVAFGRLGNILPSIFNAGAAGLGWFAVNSVSGGFALAALTHWSNFISLLIVAFVQVLIAFVGHNLIQTVEKYLMPYLIVVFGVSAIIVFTKPSVASPESWHLPGAFFLYVGAVYGYSAGWNPFSSDYSRYMPSNTDTKAAGRYAALGLLVAPTILEIVGIAAVNAGMGSYGSGNPVEAFTNFLPDWLGKLVLLGIVLGSICANVLNVYSGSMSFLTMGIKLKSNHLRAITAIGFGIGGFLIAHWAMGNPANNLENFLLVMSYWIGPWLGVIFADKILRKSADIRGELGAYRSNRAGVISFVLGVTISMLLFSNQIWFTGWVPKHHPSFGDIAFPVGFLIAFGGYFLLRMVVQPKLYTPSRTFSSDTFVADGLLGSAYLTGIGGVVLAVVTFVDNMTIRVAGKTVWLESELASSLLGALAVLLLSFLTALMVAWFSHMLRSTIKNRQ